ncbi:PREDICTED: bromodomain-containing protein DDB_G0280777 [Drosophila arizonae]|uniref:Bromodomain-containing protein DDB_G0280777 n=1 Tax=Drosophila arizonae TaxID=7263 RepID=A0ABM1P081_DROAR|nr:PREDICTED: bromodomain-containing protein DDB_G0280777 [Drosophila arizonae]
MPKVLHNFLIYYLLILQSSDGARTQPEIGRRDGLAKFEFNGRTLHVFNFAKIYETLYEQLVQPTIQQEQEQQQQQEKEKQQAPLRQGRGLRRPQTQLLWIPERQPIATTPQPFHVLQQLQHDLEEQLKHSTTKKPFSVLEQLTLEQLKLLQQKRPNSSFSILQQLQLEQEKQLNKTSTVEPFNVFEQLDKDLQEQEKHEQHVEQASTFEVVQPATAEPLEQHKSDAKVPAESSRAKDSQKRKRKRIRRRRKRIRRRRKRKRRRGKKKRKKKRKKRKKKKNKKEKKKKKKRRRQQKPEYEHPPLGQPAHLVYANPTKQPYHSHHHGPSWDPHGQQPQPPVAATTILQVVTTKRPSTTKAPFSKIKYLLRHNTLFKRKKKEWFSHVGHVLYPFIKFVAFFTVLNPFTLGVFLFTLISPVVFGFLGFLLLSVLVKPFLHLVFGVKASVDSIERQRYLANKRAEQLKLNLRPVTIHKHYYQQKPLHSTPPQHFPPLANWRRQGPPPELRRNNPPPPAMRRYNPLLPAVRAALARDDLHF